MTPSSPAANLVWDAASLSPDRVLGAVRIEAPAAAPEVARAPLALVACIDVSGSMEGEKLAQVKYALTRLVQQLVPDDLFGIVGFSDESFEVLPPSAMDARGREVAQRAISTLHTLGSTNMSGGVTCAIERASLAKAPSNAIRRVILFTDGHANVGLSEQNLVGWLELLGSARGSVGVSWFGFGEDHNAELLATLASHSAGNYVRASDAEAIADAFALELGGLLSVALSGVKMKLELSAAVASVDVLNDLPFTVDGAVAAVPMPHVLSGETRYLVFEARLKTLRPAELRPPFVNAEVAWTDPASGQAHSIRLSNADAIEGTRELVEHAALLEAGRAQAKASKLCRVGDFKGARRLVRDAAVKVAAAGTKRAVALAKLLVDASELYRPERYHASSAQLTSIRTGLGSLRPTGSELDEFFETNTQRRMRNLFRRDDQGSGSKT